MKTVTYDERTHRLVRRDVAKRFFELRKIYRDSIFYLSCCMKAVDKGMDRRMGKIDGYPPQALSPKAALKLK